MFTHAMRWTYVGYAWLILAAAIVQFFLAGLGIFAGASNFQIHRDFGYTLFFIMLIGLLPAIAARLPCLTPSSLSPSHCTLTATCDTLWYNLRRRQ